MTIFRPEAVEHAANRGVYGDALCGTPLATRCAFYIVMATTLFALGFAAFGRVTRYSRGPLLIRVDGRTELSSLTEGTVAEVLVRPGQRVPSGAPLVRFHALQVEGEVARLQDEYATQARAWLRDMNDAERRSAVISLRSELELMRRRLREQTVVAPAAGTITDVRVRPGQAIVKGATLATLEAAGARAWVQGVLPASDRPFFQTGMPVRVELSGYRYVYRWARIRQIGDEALGPQELRRYLGDALGDTLELRGPSVLVEADLGDPSFEVDGQSLRYVDGMSGQAAVCLRRERIATMLVPALRMLWP